MNKMNKKGFTLIEMLVVIAIIAVLVSIIVPVVGNSTTKAAAATNAANLRSVMAEVAAKHMAEPDKYPAGTYTSSSGVLTFSAAGATTPVTMNVPVGKAVSVGTGSTAVTVTKGNEMTVVISADEITASYGTTGTIANLSVVAETGAAPTA